MDHYLIDMKRFVQLFCSLVKWCIGNEYGELFAQKFYKVFIYILFYIYLVSF